MQFTKLEEILPTHPVKMQKDQERKYYEKPNKKRKKDYSEERKRKRGWLDD